MVIERNLDISHGSTRSSDSKDKDLNERIYFRKKFISTL